MPGKTAPVSDPWRQMAPEVQVLLLPCHMTTERHGGDPGGRVSGATWHVAAVKIVAGSSERVAGRRRRQQKNGGRIAGLRSSTVELIVWAKYIEKKSKLAPLMQLQEVVA